MSLSSIHIIRRPDVSHTDSWMTVISTCICVTISILAFNVLSKSSRTLHPKGWWRLGSVAHGERDEELSHVCGEDISNINGKNEKGIWRVSSLWIYPVKSCKGIELSQSTVVSTGMEYDRLFSFARLRPPVTGTGSTGGAKPTPGWEFITQRQFPLLAKVKTEIWLPKSASPSGLSTTEDGSCGGVLIMRFPYVAEGWRGFLSRTGTTLGLFESDISFQVPLQPTDEQIKANGYQTEQMTIWKDSPKALNMSVHLPWQLKQFLGVTHPLGLFRVASGQERKVFRCAPKKEELGWQPVTGFADAYPLHIMNLASVRDLGQRLAEQIPNLSHMRFRANIYITGPPPYGEDAWKKIRINGHVYHVACRTARCKLPNVDQETAIKHPQEPDKTLRSYRCIDEGAKKLACLGVQVVPAAQRSFIEVGNEVEVLESGEHFYLMQ